MERKLAAILIADLVGFTARMERDEKGTLEVLSAHIDDIAAPLVGQHHGHIVKQMGDGLLARFDSAVEAYSAEVSNKPHRRLEFWASCKRTNAVSARRQSSAMGPANQIPASPNPHDKRVVSGIAKK